VLAGIVAINMQQRRIKTGMMTEAIIAISILADVH
jgi:hypothetical protein